MSGPLANAKHEAFARAIVAGKSGRAAYRAAGYAKTKAAAADASASRLMKTAKVAARIAALKGAAAKTAEIDSARVLKELTRIGLSDLRRAFGPDGQLLPPGQWDDDFAAAVASIEVVTRQAPGGSDERRERQGHGGALKRRKAGVPIEHVHKIRLWPKNAALETIAKHLGMLVERHEHSGPDGAPIEARIVVVPAKEETCLRSCGSRHRSRAGSSPPTISRSSMAAPPAAASPTRS